MRLFEPFLRREIVCCARFSCFSAATSGFGALHRSPFEVTAKSVSPKSIPIVPKANGAFLSGASTGRLTYCWMTSSGAPPTVETKYEFVQRLGRRFFRDTNSFLQSCDVAPLDVLYKTMKTKLRVHFAKHVNVVWHDFQSDEVRSILSRRLTHEFLKPFGDIAKKNVAAILGHQMT
jgi:hypothetical protein